MQYSMPMPPLVSRELKKTFGPLVNVSLSRFLSLRKAQGWEDDLSLSLD